MFAEFLESLERTKRPEMAWRVWIRRRKCTVSGWKTGAQYSYFQEYSFRIWPWTNVEARVHELKRRMEWECSITVAESNSR